MAKKEKRELTPEEKAAKLEKKLTKRKLFFETFYKALAFVLALALVYSVTYIANTKGKTQAVAANGSASNGSSSSNGSGSSSSSNGSSSSNTSNGSGSSSSSTESTTAAAGTAAAGETNETQKAVDTYVAAINKTKAYTGKMTSDKTDVVKITIKQITDSSGKAVSSTVTSLAQKIVDKFVGTTNKNREFENGTETNGGGDTPMKWVQPNEVNCELTVNDIQSATIKESNGGYEITFTLKADKTTLAAPIPEHTSKVMDYLDLATVDVSPAKITTADMDYPASTVKATINSDGLLTNAVYHFDLTGTGKGKLLVELGATLEGSFDQTYNFSY